MKNKIKYYIISKIFLYIIILLVIICCIIIVNQNKKIEHMGLKYTANNIINTNTNALSKITHDLYIKPSKNIKIYNVSTQTHRTKLKKKNPAIYHRYKANLNKLKLSEDKVSRYVDTRLYK